MKKLMFLVILALMFMGLSAEGFDWAWVKKAGGASSDTGRAIAVDAAGNSYVCGFFTGTATFGSTNLTSSGESDIFVAKMDPNGNWLWAKKAGGTSSDYGIAICVNAAGNIFISGSFYGTVTFGTTNLTCSGESDIFVAKLDPNGNWLWAKRAGGSGYDIANALAVDAAGNIYLSGRYSNTAAFGTTNLTSTEGNDIFVAKLDTNGNWLWAKQAGGGSASMANAIAVDATGNSYVSGYINGIATFGSTTITSDGYIDIVVAKLDTNGNWLWAKQAGGGGSVSMANAIAVDATGNSYVSGYFGSNATFGTTNLTSSGSGDVFIAKLDTNGNWLWVKSAGGTAGVYGNAIGLDASGNCYVSGEFSGTATFSTTNLTCNGGNDIFVAKLELSPLELMTPLSGEVWRMGSIKSVYWDPSPSVSDVNILLSWNNGTDWTYLNYSPVDATLGRYSFAVPALLSEQCRIKLESGAFPTTVYEISDMFSIRSGNLPSVTITAPNALNQYLQSGHNYSVTWTSSQVSNVDLWVSYNSGVLWHNIASNLPVSTGSYNWMVPDSLSSICYLKVTDSTNPLVYDWSDNPFNISNAELLSPNGGEVWGCGTVKTISWTSANINNLKLEYSINNGTAWQQIIVSAPAVHGTYNWTVPYLISAQCLVRISDTTNATLRDESNNPFSIRPQIIVTAPNGGETLTSYNTYPIRWTVTTDVTQVYLDYSINGGTAWLPVNTNAITASLGVFNWLVPGVESTQALVRIRKSTDSSVFDLSDAVFTISQTINPPVANFSADTTSGVSPLQAQFTDLSSSGSGTISSWLWSFGDGGTSTLQHPLYTYQNTGIYTVSLRVTNSYDSTSTVIKQDYITVNPGISVLQLQGSSDLNLGSAYVEEASSYQQIVIHNSGTANLVLSNIYWSSGQHFEYYRAHPEQPILPNTEETIFVRFVPHTVGTLRDTLCVVNNSTNQPLQRISVSGVGLYVSPQSPVNVNVTMNGYDAVLTWDAVTENTHHQPLVPDYYFVYINGSPNPDGVYYFQGMSPTNQFTHPYVAMGAEYMFYRAKAIKLYPPVRGESIDMLELKSRLQDMLKIGMTESEVSNILDHLWDERQ